jgi:two-component sensor histidine kinase
VLDEEDDEIELLRYAGEIDVDPEKYRQALSEVTRMPRERFASIAEALFLLAQQLSKLALQNVQQAQYITHLSGKIPGGMPESPEAIPGLLPGSAIRGGERTLEVGNISSRPTAAGTTGAEEAWMLRFRELQHRIKNSLSIIDALIGFQINIAEDPCRSGLEALRNRVATISRLYDLLYRAPTGSKVPLDEYLGEIAESLRIRSSGTITWELAALEAAPGKAISIGLILNEALVNSYKYAGLATVQVRLEAEGKLARLSVSDDGPGFDPAALEARETDASRGVALMRLLGEQLGGETRIESSPGRGTKISLQFPLD